ncbi:serine hydrolase [Costertonia aggregata]|uniref:Serine hydrolase n=1 Tax=Costertonia aggregata TaxID=343403 RepID=A0A7H9AUB2_9FLAO|nr:serine hydrolase [Costertonia aggregata]QLG46977.1 serine hydrolase [Costertonia aggregata]
MRKITFLLLILPILMGFKNSRKAQDKILFIVSNQHTYGNTNLNTANHFSEIVLAYDVFEKKGYKVDFVSPEGGAIPVGYIKTSDSIQKKYLYDADFMNLLKTTLKPEVINPEDYKAVYYVGGGAAMFGVPDNKAIQAITMSIYNNNGVVSAVCHGTAGIVDLKTDDGSYLVNGKKANGFPDKFENQSADYYKTFPFSIEEAITRNGGKFMYSKKGWDNHYIVDGRLVTGQDPSASKTVAEKVVELLEKQNKQFIGLKENVDLKSKVDNYVNKIMEEFDIKGTAVAILKDNQVIHKAYYGKANIAYDIPVSNTSIFKTHSLTKLFVSVAVFKLIQNKKINLEDAIGEFLPDLPLNWKSIQIKHLLSHSSGLPTMPVSRNLTELEAQEIIFNKNIQTSPGKEYHYNRTNLWLLKQLIEKVSKRKFQDLIVENQFNGNDTGISFSGDILDIVPNRVTEYYPNKNYEPKIFDFYLPDYLLSAGGLNITLDTYIKWDQQFNVGSLLNQKNKTIMTTPFPYKDGSSFFSYGWRIEYLNKIKTIGFSGGGISVFKKIPSKNMTIIFLSNGYRYDPYIERVSNNLLGIVDETLRNTENLASEELEIAINKKNYKNVQILLNRLKDDKDYSMIDFEMIINEIGYSFLNAIQPRLNEAIEVFKLNTRNYPKSWNAFDSLAEAFGIKGDIKNAKINYEKALELTPKGNAANIERITNLIKNLKKSN